MKNLRRFCKAGSGAGLLQPRKAGDPAGFTIPEVLIAASLTLLLLGLIFSFLVPTMRASIRGSAKAEIQQEALRSIDRVAGDLLMSASPGITVVTPASAPEKGPAYIGIIRISDVDHLGKQTWEQSLTLYCWQGPGKPLVRKVWTQSLPPSLGIALNTGYPCRFDAASLASIAEEPALRGQIIARDVSEMLITHKGSGISVSSPIDLTIEISRDAATVRNGPEIFRMKRIITLRAQL